MNAQRLARYKNALETMRDELIAAGPAKIEPHRSGPATVDVSDEDAQALSEMLQTLASQQNRKRALQLAQLEQALRRLAEEPDEFGRCAECDEEIGEKRLALLPHATLCTECQAQHDPRRGASRRGLTDYR